VFQDEHVLMIARPPRHYFPVAVSHRMPGEQPGLGAVGVGDQWIERDRQLAEYRDVKQSTPDAVHRSDYDGSRADEQRALHALRPAIASAYPEAAAEYQRIAGLDELVSRIQEDVVIMRRDPSDASAAKAAAVYLNVCFPTGWCPPCMKGRSFLQIHGPVPALHDFAAAAARGRWAQDLFGDTGRATVRFVWTITPDASLDRRRCVKGLHPNAATTSWRDATGAYFRVERQVIVPLTTTLGLFLIRIYQRDVTSLESHERRRLRDCVQVMEPRLLAYKGFATHEEKILGLLR